MSAFMKLMMGKSGGVPIEEWMKDAATNYSLDVNNIATAYAENSLVKDSFVFGTTRPMLCTTSNAYINLGYKPLSTDRIALAGYFSSVGTYAYGWITSSAKNSVNTYTWGSTYLRYGYTGNWDIKISAGTKVCINATKLAAFSSGSYGSVSDLSALALGGSSTINAYLFGCNNNGSVSYGNNWYISHFCLQESSGNVKMFLIPFTRNDVNGMLDLVSMTFYTSANSGTFVLAYK